MAYNNGFPMGYQPVQPIPQNPVPPRFNGNVAQQPQYDASQQMMSQQFVTPTQNSMDKGGIVWVQGDAGARSFLVAPNQSVMLMDSEDNCFYIKSADASGMPLPLRVFDYKERMQDSGVRNAVQEQTPQPDMSQYVTKDVFEDTIQNYESQISELVEKINQLVEERNHNDQSAKRRK